MPLTPINASPKGPSERLCWVVSDGRRGIENQALGLAEAIADRTPMRILRLHTPLPRVKSAGWPRRLQAQSLQPVTCPPLIKCG